MKSGGANSRTIEKLRSGMAITSRDANPSAKTRPQAGRKAVTTTDSDSTRQSLIALAATSSVDISKLNTKAIKNVDLEVGASIASALNECLQNLANTIEASARQADTTAGDPDLQVKLPQIPNALRALTGVVSKVAESKSLPKAKSFIDTSLSSAFRLLFDPAVYKETSLQAVTRPGFAALKLYLDTVARNSLSAH